MALGLLVGRNVCVWGGWAEEDLLSGMGPNRTVWNEWNRVKTRMVY